MIGQLHQNYVFSRRVRVLSDRLAALLPEGARVLDVGSGDGLISHLIQERRPDVRISGIDVLIRPTCHIPVERFDGRTIPHDDGSFDAVMFVDVLHHTEDPMVLLREADRVARGGILIKDHTRDGLLAGPTLRFMDHVGNCRHGVNLPYNYWPRRRWEDAARELDWRVGTWADRLAIYPRPADWIFGRRLHFIGWFVPGRLAPAA